MALDLNEEFDILFVISEAELPELNAHFDPAAFVETNPLPKVAAWKLSDDRLRQLSLNTIRIRKSINEKATSQQQDEEIPLGDDPGLGDDQVDQRAQIVIRRSTRASNPEGLLEKELRAQQPAARYPGRYYRKRPLAELTSSEITDIVHGYLVEHLS